MKNIVVQDQNYRFEDIPGKGVCLVPVEDKFRFSRDNICMGKILRSANNDLYIVAGTGPGLYSLINIRMGTHPGYDSFNVTLEDIIRVLNNCNTHYKLVTHIEFTSKV